MATGRSHLGGGSGFWPATWAQFRRAGNRWDEVHRDGTQDVLGIQGSAGARESTQLRMIAAGYWPLALAFCCGIVRRRDAFDDAKPRRLCSARERTRMTASAQRSDELVRTLEARAREIREKTIRLGVQSGSTHFGGSLSMVDVLVVLYFHVLRIDPQRPDW